MRLFPLLLRVLVCLSLVANGIGFAQAAARMPWMHAADAAHTQMRTVAPGAMSGCHEPGEPLAEPAYVAHGVAHSQAPDVPPGHGDGLGCCEGDSCQCSCTPPAPVAFVAAFAAAALPAGAEPGREAATGRPDARPSHLIRPPIG